MFIDMDISKDFPEPDEENMSRPEPQVMMNPMKAAEMNRMPKFWAEFFGTLVLVLFGCGSIAFPTDPSFITISFSFGLAFVAMWYAIAPTSGCHINPSVSLGMWIGGRMSFIDMLIYWIAQALGAIGGAALVWLIVSGRTGYMMHLKGLGANCWGHKCLDEYDVSSAFLAEVVFTFIFVVVVMGSTMKVPKQKKMVPQETHEVAGLAIGMTLTAIHLCGLPVTGVSLNPARSFGPAVIVGGPRLAQLWLFIVAPFLGATIAGLVFRYACPMAEWNEQCFHVKKCAAEFFGTFTLVFIGVGTAVFTTLPDRLNIAIAFGFGLIAAAYGIGVISGGHINPAVTMGVYVADRLEGGVKVLLIYWFGQFLGGLIAASTVFGIVCGRPDYSVEKWGLGANGWGSNEYGVYDGASAFFGELIFTFLFVFSILGSTSQIPHVKTYLAGISIGLTLLVIHIISIPITGTSVNPARSLGPALIVGGVNLAEYWLFFVAPILGGGLAGFIYRLRVCRFVVDHSAIGKNPERAS